MEEIFGYGPGGRFNHVTGLKFGKILDGMTMHPI